MFADAAGAFYKYVHYVIIRTLRQCNKPLRSKPAEVRLHDRKSITIRGKIKKPYRNQYSARNHDSARALSRVLYILYACYILILYTLTVDINAASGGEKNSL